MASTKRNYELLKKSQSLIAFPSVWLNNLKFVKVKVRYPRYRPAWPRGVLEVKAPRFLDTRHMKMVRSSPLRTGRLYPQEYPGTHF